MLATVEGVPRSDSSREPDPAAVRVGAEIRAARTQLGLSTRDLAALIDTSQPFVSNIENGRIFPSLRTLALIARALDVPPERLLPYRENLQRTEASVGLRPRRAGEDAARHLVGGKGTTLNAYRIELGCGEVETRPFVHDGNDLIFVLHGRVELLREGLPAVTLARGESIEIDGLVPHRLAGGEDEGGTAFVTTASSDDHAGRPAP